VKQLKLTGWPGTAMGNLRWLPDGTLATRPVRHYYTNETGITGLTAGDDLCVTQGADALISIFRQDMSLSPGEKQLVLLGEELLILPDKKYINVLDLSWGSIEVTARAECKCSLCDRSGKVYTLNYAGTTQPAAPVCGEYWVDATVSPPVLRQFGPNGRWVTVPDTCVRLEGTGIGKSFAAGDGVTLYGGSVTGPKTVRARGQNYIVVDGIIGQAETVTVTVERTMPDMDFVVACGDRLWGCCYEQGVNTVYCSRAGDCKNWLSFGGADTDSWQAQVGVPGAFTGAVAFGKRPLFFKEKWLLEVTGTTPDNFRVESRPCRGVRNGCAGSLAVVGEKLCYCAPTGIMVYAGGSTMECVLPGDFRNAKGGGIGSRYYVSLEEGTQTHLLVYDTAGGLWHREDDLSAADFTAYDGKLYCRSGGRVLCFSHIGRAAEQTVSWYLETPRQCLAGQQALQQVQLCLELGDGAAAKLSVSYDDGPWEVLGDWSQPGLRTQTAMPRCRYCQHYRLRLEGSGDMTLHSLRTGVV